MKKENKNTVFSNHNYATLKKSYMSGLNYYDDLNNEIAREEAEEFASDLYNESAESNAKAKKKSKAEANKGQGHMKKECACEKKARAKKAEK